MILQLIISIVVIVCIVMGSVHWNHCPNTPGLPITLIISGLLFYLASLIWLVQGRLANREAFVGSKYWKLLRISEFATIALLITSWAIWLDFVYTAHHPTFDDPGKDDYCEKLFFNFSSFLLPLFLFFGQVIFLLIKYGFLRANRSVETADEAEPLIT